MNEYIHYRNASQEDKEWIEKLMNKEWASTTIVSRGKIYNTIELPGIVAEVDNKPQGLITYNPGSAFEIITLNSLIEGKGIGTGLINELKMLAKKEEVHRIIVVTTNDNKKALSFYQKRGFKIVAEYPNAVEESRKLKPEIPLYGEDGTPIKNEIELEMKI